MKRKLASVQKIKAIKPIEGADRIECVQVLNWECVASKGQFHTGDLVIYFEIDSLLPDIPAFEFLKGSSWSQKLNKYKISTHKFRNQISQGLVMSIDTLPDLESQINGIVDKLPYFEGDDLTELLKIEKYEPPVSNGQLGEIISHEWYVPKTDEERIQTCAENVIPEYIKAGQDDWYCSVKLDGTSCTAGLFEDGFFIGGRTQWYKGPNFYTETIKKYGDLEEKLKSYLEKHNTYVVFQGELCGPGIQKNKLGLSEKEWFVFNVFISDTGKYDRYTKVDLDEMIYLCAEFGLKTVPIVATADKFTFEHKDVDSIVNELLEYADTFKYADYFEGASPKQIAEGLVFRLNDMTNSFKVISNKYLLKGGE